MSTADWRLSVARRPYQNTMDICDIDLTALMGARTPDAQLALVLPVFAWERTSPLHETCWSRAQLEGYRRFVPWHVLSLYRNSDFAEADITFYLALSETAYPLFEETLTACNFPEDRILRFEQHPTARAWINKLVVLFDARLDGYAGVIHTDVSLLMVRGRQGQRFEGFREIVQEWDTERQDFLVMQEPFAACRPDGNSLEQGIIRCKNTFGLSPHEVWERLSQLSQQPAVRLRSDWAAMAAQGCFYDLIGAVFGIGRSLRTDATFRQHILALLELLETDEAALAFYFYERQMVLEDVYHYPFLGGVDSYQQVVEWHQPQYLYALPRALDADELSAWESLYRNLRVRPTVPIQQVHGVPSSTQE